MKSLIISAAVAMIAGICTAEISSSNIVGYLNDETTAKNKGVGSVFVPVAGGATYKLKDLSVTSPDGIDDPLDVEGEYIQVLNPNGSAVIARYTYVSKDYVDMIDDAEVVTDAQIGWWKWSKNIMDWNPDDRADDVDIDIGQAFLCAFGGTPRIITSAGAVEVQPTSITTSAKNLFFLSYLPTVKKLSQYTVTSPDGIDDPLDVEGEYIQVLNPNGSAVTARYTYVSKDYVDMIDDAEVVTDAQIGWWKWSKNIMDWNPDDRVDSLDVNPGDAFLCAFGGTARTISFPGALDEAK